MVYWFQPSTSDVPTLGIEIQEHKLLRSFFGSDFQLSTYRRWESKFGSINCYARLGVATFGSQIWEIGIENVKISMLTTLLMVIKGLINRN